MLIYLHYICLACRRCAKQQPRRSHEDYAPLKCAQCAHEMVCVGPHFTAPSRRADGQWKKLAWMIASGWRGDGWPVAPRMNLPAVKKALREDRELRVENAKRETAEISFERAQLQARWNFRRSRTARRREQLELKAQQKYQNAVLARANKP